MISQETAVLLIIDMQEKLLRAMHEKDELLRNAVRAVQAAVSLGLPILWTEQNPKGLGPTVPELAEILTGSEAITKFSFSCYGEPKFQQAVSALRGKTVLTLGIESHVCVYQTVADLLEANYKVEIVTDAVSARTPENRKLGFNKCVQLGARLTGVEMFIFELLRTAEHPKFKEAQKLIK